MNKTALGVLILVLAGLLIWGVSSSNKGDINKLAEGTAELVKDAGDTLVDGADAVIDGAEKIADDAEGMAKEAIEKVDEGAEKLVDNAAEVVKDVEGNAIDAMDKVGEEAKKLMDEGEEMVDDMMDNDPTVDEDDMQVDDNMDTETTKDGTYAINKSESALLRKGATPLKSHNGDVQITSGEVTVTDGIISGGEFEIDMTSIDTVDLKEDEVDGMDEHLYGPDFFDVEKYPTAMLVITDVTGDTVTADLTIKGQTHPVSFDVDVNGNKAMTSFEIDRTVWGIEYNSPSLVDSIKDKAINNEIEFDVTLMW